MPQLVEEDSVFTCDQLGMVFGYHGESGDYDIAKSILGVWLQKFCSAFSEVKQVPFVQIHHKLLIGIRTDRHNFQFQRIFLMPENAGQELTLSQAAPNPFY